MADIGTLFIGFSGDDYETLIKNATIAAYLDGKVTPINVEGVTYYIFDGDNFELLEMAEDADIIFDLMEFEYLKSTWNIIGF